MRQYARLKGEKGRAFTYQDIKKVCVIVLFEKSPGIFQEIHHAYLHYGKTRFDSGPKLLVPDAFRGQEDDLAELLLNCHSSRGIP